MENIFEFGILTALKALLVLGEVVYVIFAVVVVRQVQLMVGTLDGQANGLIKLVAWLHLFAAVGVLVMSVVLL